MSEKLVNSVISALIGGVVGAVVVFFVSGKTSFDSLEVASLKVGDLTIKQQATLLNAEGKDDVVIKEGSVLANNVILGKKFIGTQYQGHVFVANRMFTSPDDLVGTPMEQWRFYTEIGSSQELGGELVVRSPNGANVVGQPVNKGMFLRAGFNEQDGPMMFVRHNEFGTMAQIPLMIQRPAAQEGQENPEGAQSAGDETAAAPATTQEGPAVASPPQQPIQ